MGDSEIESKDCTSSLISVKMSRESGVHLRYIIRAYCSQLSRQPTVAVRIPLKFSQFFELMIAVKCWFIIKFLLQVIVKLVKLTFELLIAQTCAI